MQKKLIEVFALLMILGILPVLEQVAEARRMGGGRSFGSRPSYQRGATKPTQPDRDSKQTSGQNNPQDQRGALGGIGQPGGLFGGLKGALGGILVGGLVGSLLFGGMRGFSGPGFLDILIVGGLLFMAFRYFSSRRMARETAGGPLAYEAIGQGLGGREEQGFSVPPVPKGFDREDFMAGAKAVYSRLQSSWDRRDLEDIKQFTSPEVFDEIRRQAEEDPTPGKTEILKVGAELLEAKGVEGDTVASVLFDVLMREGSEDRFPRQVREVWHFSRKESVPGALWVLEGMQQLD